MNGIMRIFAGLVMVAVCTGCDRDDVAVDDTEAGAETAGTSTGHVQGRVTGPEGEPEAGVWVIAETTELPSTLRKIVVTNEQGRFVLPELPQAEYQVRVRGYGLVDSEPVAAAPGATLELEARPAPDARAAARIYPANHWLSLLEPPEQRADWASHFKLGCQLCHQMGSLATRIQDRAALDRGLKKASFMQATANGFDRDVLLDTLADWTGRIRAGETPPAPRRPEGIERNLVITQWEWGDRYTYAHDEVTTDKRDPTVNANGPVYAVDLGNDRLLEFDPRTLETSMRPVPTRDGFDTPWCEQTFKAFGMEAPVPFGLGSLGCPVEPGITPHEGAYANPANPHNPMMDAEGRVWLTTQIRREWDEDLPEFCQDAPAIVGRPHHRQLAWFDPDTDEFQLIDTCFGTHHLQFDHEGVLWTSGDSYVLGWFDPSRYDPEDPATLEAAQGWSEVKVDSDGDGEADLPLVGFNYGVMPDPVTGAVWTAQPAGSPGQDMDNRGRLIRYDPERDRFETFVPPMPGAGPRGIEVDGDGVVWTALGGSGHLARFDRSACEQTRGAGDQCPEGWTLYRSPGPEMRTDPALGSDFHYYLWVDRFDTLGMGEDTVILNGTGSDSLLAFDPEAEAFTVIRIPYPLNTFTRLLDGRIDDPDAGWKGRGLWFNNGLDPILHSEVRMGYVGRVQLRPDPLAR
ncbi:MAG: carboxypeptidase regulatory-like domain-containing protein [Gammaproteobacteria bacterium]|nr:carboxypeptidase regulatory-like domain-containing protein [Gammaproteobacteria bacterium]